MKVEIKPVAKLTKKVTQKAIAKRNISKIAHRQATQQSNKLYARVSLERQAEMMNPEDYIKARAYLADAEKDYFASSNFIF